MPITPQQAAAKGKGWVDKNNPNYGTAGFVGAEDEDDYQAPAAAPPPGPVAAPNLGPMVANPETGTAGHDPSVPMPAPAPPIPPPATAPERVAAPTIPPLAVPPTGGPATHQPEGGADGGPDPANPGTDTAAPPPIPHGGPPAPAPPTLDTKFRDALMDLLDTTDPSMSDPTIKAQSDAYSLAQTRARQRDREAMAGRAAASGQLSDLSSSGAFDEGLSNLEQRQGESEGAFDAGLLQQELEARRNQLMSAAALAGNQLSEEDRLAFQREFAQINADLERARLNQQGSQFDRSLALDSRRLDEASKQWGQQFGLEGQRLAESIRQFDTTTQAGRDQLKQQLEMFKTSQAQQGKQFDVDAELRRMGIDSQTALGNRDLGLRDKLGSGSLMMQYLNALIGNSNFKDNLGANIGMFNQKSLLELLGMA